MISQINEKAVHLAVEIFTPKKGQNSYTVGFSNIEVLKQSKVLVERLVGLAVIMLGELALHRCQCCLDL